MKNFCDLPNKFGCREDTLAHLMDLMRQGGKSIPCETEEAVELFLWILQQLHAYSWKPPTYDITLYKLCVPWWSLTFAGDYWPIFFQCIPVCICDVPKYLREK